MYNPINFIMTQLLASRKAITFWFMTTFVFRHSVKMPEADHADTQSQYVEIYKWVCSTIGHENVYMSANKKTIFATLPHHSTYLIGVKEQHTFYFKKEKHAALFKLTWYNNN